MTDKGTFIINGAERVVVSQLHDHRVCFSDYRTILMEQNYTQLVLSPSKDRGLNLRLIFQM